MTTLRIIDRQGYSRHWLELPSAPSMPTFTI